MRQAAAPLAAFVLHRWDWSESSLIVELFTRESGRVAVAAKGAKRPTSNLRAVLMPFQRIHVALGRARDEAAAEIHNLRSAEWAGGEPLRGAQALLSGFYANELVMKLLAREDAHPLSWDAYAATLPHLGGAAESAALRAFELVLLADAGHLPDIARVTATQAPVDGGKVYLLRAESGLVEARAGDEAALSGGALASLQSALAARDVDALRRACAADEPALRRQLRLWLAYHLGGVPLRTRDVVRDLQPLLTCR